MFLLDTSDVKAVIATVVDESTVSIQCTFIYGSDAMGCRVVLVSDHSGSNNQMTMLRNNESDFAHGTLNLTHPVYCYSRLIVYDIEADGTFSNLMIIVDDLVDLQQNSTTRISCPGIYII